MNILFLDAYQTAVSDEDALVKGMSGIPSCLFYLSDELARRGHTVLVAVRGEPQKRRSGTNIVNVYQISRDIVESSDVVIVNNNAFNATAIRQFSRRKSPIIIWEHLQNYVSFHEFGATAHALDSDHRNSADAIVFVSEWQKYDFLNRYPIDPRVCHVIHNACNPWTCAMSEPDFQRKRQKLEVAYISAPERGLLRLLRLWPAIVARHPEAKLCIYSGRSLYGIDDRKDSYNQIVSNIEFPSIEYRGALPHLELSRFLANTAILAYPTDFDETSAIAVLEAAASACSVVCSDIGALPETLAGYGCIVSRVPDDARFEEDFVLALDDILGLWKSGDRAFYSRLELQGRLFRETYSWSVRASEWEALFQHLCRNLRATSPAYETRG